MPTTSSYVNPALGISDIEITEEIVRKKLATIHQDKAGGVDDILPRLLANIQNEISYPLWKLFCKSVSEGAVPEDWRRANVTPIFKKGNKGSQGNYRPVSLTSQCCKLLEAIIRDSMIEYLDKSKVITDSQHGFRTGRSCLSNLLSFFDQVSEGVDTGTAIDVIYLSM